MQCKMSLKSRIQIVPLQRSKTQTITICKQGTLKELQSRILIQSSYNRQACQLNICHNKISQLPCYDTRFQSLVVSHCQLKEVSQVLGANLVRVDLSNNLLTKVPQLQSKRLEVLWMKNNRVEVLDMLLMRYPLKQIRFAGNNLRVFYVGVLRKGVDNDLELMRFVDVAGISRERYATLEEIMDAAGNFMESQKMIKAAVDCEYPEMIKYLAKRKQSDVDGVRWSLYAKKRNLGKALQTLIQLFAIKEGFQKQRTMFLNPECFDVDLLGSQITFQNLLQALNHQNPINPAKSLGFLQFVYSHIPTFLNSQNIPLLFMCGNLETLLQILSFEDITKYCAEHRQLIVDSIIDYDSPVLFEKLIKIDTLRSRVFGRKKPKILIETDPSHKIYKYVVKEWKYFVKDQLKRKNFNFTEYQTHARRETISSFRTQTQQKQQCKLLRDYEKLQSFGQSETDRICTPLKSQNDQENKSPLGRSSSRFLSISKQISDKYNKSSKLPIKSMTALAIQKIHLNR